MSSRDAREAKRLARLDKPIGERVPLNNRETAFIEEYMKGLSDEAKVEIEAQKNLFKDRKEADVLAKLAKDIEQIKHYIDYSRGNISNETTAPPPLPSDSILHVMFVCYASGGYDDFLVRNSSTLVQALIVIAGQDFTKRPTPIDRVAIGEERMKAISALLHAFAGLLRSPIVRLFFAQQDYLTRFCANFFNAVTDTPELRFLLFNVLAEIAGNEESHETLRQLNVHRVFYRRGLIDISADVWMISFVKLNLTKQTLHMLSGKSEVCRGLMCMMANAGIKRDLLEEGLGDRLTQLKTALKDDEYIQIELESLMMTVLDSSYSKFLRSLADALPRADLAECSTCKKRSCADVKLRKCSGCGVAQYCGRECQLADWKKGHKEACKNLKASSPSTTS
eukprot:TRINITY_DN8120_c0_g1_i1.p1 TRINITY_DN8120_c0_g1~~TRINITY_DN8120_c0_g1_i1.p1  ORF type:complete len:404 (+),score=74.39 TRINITY_DN8120_c0_g1_i1:33-1214(+)